MEQRSVKPHMQWIASLFVAGLAMGCGNYTSNYSPPKDGRARAVWQEDRVVASLPADAQSGECRQAVSEVQTDPGYYRTYYGGSPNIIIWRPWVIVTGTGSSRVAASPTVSRVPATGSVKSPSRGGGGRGSSVGSGGGSSGGSSGGGGNGDLGKAAVVLVVVALLTLPIITLGLGLGRPEPSKEVAEQIDAVNAYNDLARLNGSPCGAEAE
jgi:hypothetical protein